MLGGPAEGRSGGGEVRRRGAGSVGARKFWTNTHSRHTQQTHKHSRHTHSRHTTTHTTTHNNTQQHTQHTNTNTHQHTPTQPHTHTNTHTDVVFFCPVCRFLFCPNVCLLCPVRVFFVPRVFAYFVPFPFFLSRCVFLSRYRVSPDLGAVPPAGIGRRQLQSRSGAGHVNDLDAAPLEWRIRDVQNMAKVSAVTAGSGTSTENRAPVLGQGRRHLSNARTRPALPGPADGICLSSGAASSGAVGCRNLRRGWAAVSRTALRTV